jgi:signal peptidase
MSPPDDGDRERADAASPDAPPTRSDGADDDQPPAVSGDEAPASDSGDHTRPASESGWSDTDHSTERPGSDRTGDGTDSSNRTGDDTAGTNWTVFVYDVLNSAVAVLLVGALLFAVSGVWPPMVAIESPSMTPQMETGDLVFVMEETRFPGEGAHEGVVTARTGRTTDADYRKFGRQGDVIVYKPDGDGDATPIIHRAMFWVEEGENWYDRADRQSVGRYDRCGESVEAATPNCPAPSAGFITKGDANSRYDQVDGLSSPVKPAWVVGTAEVRVPLLGCIRLRSGRCANGVFGTVGRLASQL